MMRWIIVVAGILLLVGAVSVCTSGGNKGESKVDNLTRAMDDLVQAIASDNSTEREEAEQAFRVARSKMIMDLIAIVDRPAVKGEPWRVLNTPRNVAMSVLGKMRAKEAASHLVNWLGPYPGQSGTTISRSGHPAMRALVEIGKPSVPHLLRVLSNTRSGIKATPNEFSTIREFYMRYYALETLRLIFCYEEDCAKFILKKAIESEKDPQKKANLQDALKHFEDKEKNK